MTFTEAEPTLDDLFAEFFRDFTDNFSGPMLAEVQSYNISEQSADCKPLVKIWLRDQSVELPILRSVPVLWPGGGSGSLHFGLTKGDVGQIIIQQNDHSAWYASGSKNQDSPTSRRFALSDVAFIPRINPKSNPLGSNATHASSPVLSGNPVLLGDSTAAEFVALANKVLAELQNIKTWADAHVHSGVTTGPGITGAPSVPMPSPGSVECTKVKAK